MKQKECAYLEEIMQIITEILYKIHVTQERQDLLLDFHRERHFGLR